MRIPRRDNGHYDGVGCWAIRSHRAARRCCSTRLQQNAQPLRVLACLVRLSVGSDILLWASGSRFVLSRETENCVDFTILHGEKFWPPVDNAGCDQI